MEKCVSKTTVQRLLIFLGIAPKMLGYGYLTSAILMKLQGRPHDVAMVKMYERIGAENGVTASSVERCMRFSVGRAFDITRLAGLNRLYHTDVITELPMLSDFIMYVVEYLDCFYLHDDFRIG